MIRRLLPLTLALLLLGGCGGGAGESGVERSVDNDGTADPADEAETEEVIEVVVGASVDELVAVTAQWQCDRQRFAFDSLDDIDTLLADTLTTAGIETEAFEAFQAELEKDAELRLRVREAFIAECI